MDSVARHLEWVNAEIQSTESYHSHKETMAWLATAFYVTGAITLGYLLADSLYRFKIIATVAIPLAAYFFGLFINMQFYNRWFASDVQKGLMRFAADLCCNSPTLTLPARPDYTQDETGNFPDHVWRYIHRSRPCKRQFWKSVIWKGIFCPWKLDKVIRSRCKTEIPSYALILIALVVAISLLWVN